MSLTKLLKTVYKRHSLGRNVGLVISIGVVAVVKVLSLSFALGAIGTVAVSLSLDAFFESYVGYLFRVRNPIIDVPAFVLGTVNVSRAIDWLLNLHPNLTMTTEINVFLVLWNFMWFHVGSTIRGLVQP
mgnify:CR=1 FL=1